MNNSVNNCCDQVHQNIINSVMLYDELSSIEKYYYNEWLTKNHPDFNPHTFNHELVKEINSYIDFLGNDIKPKVNSRTFFESLSTDNLILILMAHTCSELFIDMAFRKAKLIDIPLFLHNVVEEDYACSSYYLRKYIEKHKNKDYFLFADNDFCSNFQVKFLNICSLIRTLNSESLKDKYIKTYINEFKFLESPYIANQFCIPNDILPLEYDLKLPPYRAIEEMKTANAHLHYECDDNWEFYMIAGGDLPELGYVFYGLVFSPYTNSSGEFGMITLKQLKEHNPTLDEDFSTTSISDISNKLQE